MEKAEKPAVNRALYLVAFAVLAAALLLGITAYFELMGQEARAANFGSAEAGNYAPSLNGSVEQQAQKKPNSTFIAPNGSVATGPGEEAQAPQDSAPKAKEVTIDFLYADWCSHCQAMKPIVARLEAALPNDRFEVRYWNEASRSDAAVAAIYATYTDKGYFTGFPTFVANGNDPRVGSMPEAAFKSWVCLKFSSPKPQGC